LSLKEAMSASPSRLPFPEREAIHEEWWLRNYVL
jgi:hypothetical protein